MKRNFFSFSYFFFLFCTFALISCKKEISQQTPLPEIVSAAASSAKGMEKMNTFYGPQAQIANGKARSFIIMSDAGVPAELGIEITSGAFSGLPTEDGNNGFQLSLHQKAKQATPFDHIQMDWNPHGHLPEVLFGLPHFDFHFYTITKAAQESIPAYTPGSLHDLLPAPQYRPAGYIPLPGGEPKMGKHWADIIHPVTPGNFTHTMIYGSYNGAMIFVEPMITRAYLLSLTSKVSVAYGQPSVYMESNTWYPTVYNMYTNEDKSKYYVTLSSFVLSQ